MDTTVILAQPRVPRLRAAVVYVDHRQIAGRTVDPGFCSARFTRRPPLGVQSRIKTDAEQVRKSDLNKGEISRLLAAQTQGFLYIRIIS